MIEIQENSLDGRILKILLRKYPISFDELHKNLKIKKPLLKFAIRKLQRQGLVHLEILPEKSYIRLRRTSIRFKSFKRSNKKIVKHKLRRKVRISK